jgi:hypothetical protein
MKYPDNDEPHHEVIKIRGDPIYHGKTCIKIISIGLHLLEEVWKYQRLFDKSDYEIADQI